MFITQDYTVKKGTQGESGELSTEDNKHTNAHFEITDSGCADDRCYSNVGVFTSADKAVKVANIPVSFDCNGDESNLEQRCFDAMTAMLSRL